MPQNNLPDDFHECDLFLMSSHQPWFANRSLEQFAVLGRNNVHGWGIGSYRDGRANILKSELSALDSGDVSREFNIAMGATNSELILGHLRLTSSGGTRIENNHPFKLNFLGYDWLMIHNGTGHYLDELVPHNERLLLNSTNDSARAFELLRREIISYYLRDHKKSLIEAVRHAYANLLDGDTRGGYNIILSNGYLTWCFVHHRTFYMLNREKEPGNVAIVSTLKLNRDEDWFEFNVPNGKRAKMLVFSGHSLIWNGDVR